MIRKPITLKAGGSLSARPIALLVQEANQYNSSLHIEVDNKKINAKSIMGMMSLQPGKYEELTIVADGEDEMDAVQGVENFLVSNM